MKKPACITVLHIPTQALSTLLSLKRRPYFARVSDSAEDGSTKGALSACPMGLATRPSAPQGAAAASALDTGAASCPQSSGNPGASCPHAAGAAQPKADDHAVPEKAASCPYGFGSTSGPKLSALHCMLCRTFMHDSVKVRKPLSEPDHDPPTSTFPEQHACTSGSSTLIFIPGVLLRHVMCYGTLRGVSPSKGCRGAQLLCLL